MTKSPSIKRTVPVSLPSAARAAAARSRYLRSTAPSRTAAGSGSGAPVLDPPRLFECFRGVGHQQRQLIGRERRDVTDRHVRDIVEGGLVAHRQQRGSILGCVIVSDQPGRPGSL
jgi:hypothetical protein